eukprot:TRINITY_DN45_c0_g1_i3.p1 TRINITY_DN45_c0_g1~~TRINITY_DN45_c0_g1_i3.p1  ORF type:complete len:213 (-),score=45.45 TRINITY_DN45_c0_g1_i3:208-846(-)
MFKQFSIDTPHQTSKLPIHHSLPIHTHTHTYIHDMSINCAGCGKVAYPNEQVKALDVTWHKKCLKCETCKTTLSLNNLKSFDKKPYCQSHVPTVKHTTVADDVMTQHGKQAQEVTSYSVKTNIETQKGTGEKPTQTADDQMIQFGKTAQQVTSYSVKTNIETQKGTGEKPTQTADDQMIQFGKTAQQVTSYSVKTNIETQKGTGEKPNQDVV